MITVYNQKGLDVHGIYWTENNEYYKFTYNKMSKECLLEYKDSIVELQIRPYLTNVHDEIEDYIRERRI